MKPFLAACALALFTSAAPASPIVSPAELGALLAADAVTIVDIRSADAYAQSHIPGALSSPYAAWRGPADSPGTLPPLTQLTIQVRQLGLDAASARQIVVVSSGENVSDFGAAARVYWTLKYLGLAHLSILNGGMQAWGQAQQPVTADVSDLPAPSRYVPVLNDAILATPNDVLAGIGQVQVRLIDARPLDFYLGKTKAPTAAVAGTIRGAVNLAHSVWFKPGSTQIVSASEARAIAAQQFPERMPSSGEDNIVFCNTGHWAATDWFALSELAGLPNIRMYPESLAQWTNAQDPLPMDHTPGRASQISETFKSLFKKSAS